MENKSRAAINRERIRNSPEMMKFRKQIIDFLNDVNADEETQYILSSDLGKMTNMPFYKQPKLGRKPNHIIKPNVIVKNYISLFTKHYSKNKDLEFIEKLFSWLTRNQSQYLRKLSKRTPYQKERARHYGNANGIWEHPVPAKVTKDFLIHCIINNEMDPAFEYIDRIYECAHQVFLTKDENDLVCLRYNDKMPDGWDWQSGDIFARYRGLLSEDIFMN